MLDGKGNISKTLNCEDIFSKNIEKHKESNQKILESLKTKGKKPESLDKKIKKILKKSRLKSNIFQTYQFSLNKKITIIILIIRITRK